MLSGNLVTQIADIFLKTDRSGNVSDARFNNYSFYRHTGQKLPGSRCFCVLRKGKIFSEDEIREWGRNPGLWFECGGIGKPGGRLPDTNEETIWANLGGYECVDFLMPIPLKFVPATVKSRQA